MRLPVPERLAPPARGRLNAAPDSGHTALSSAALHAVQMAVRSPLAALTMYVRRTRCSYDAAATSNLSGGGLRNGCVLCVARTSRRGLVVEGTAPAAARLWTEIGKGRGLRPSHVTYVD